MSSAEPALRSRPPSGQLARGTLLVLAGQASFVLAGYALHFFMSRSLDAATFGSYAVILSLLVWTESILETGVPWAVRKLLPADPRSAPSILRAGLRWQMIVATVLYVAATLAVPWLTGALRGPDLAFYLRVALVDILFMALYTFHRAVLNALRLFAAQGTSMAAYALSKLASSVLLVQAGFSLGGALIGNVLGSLLGWVATYALVRRVAPPGLRALGGPAGQAPRDYGGREILAFAGPTVWFTLASTFLTSIGLVSVKAWVADGAQVGYYAAAAYMANAPTLLLVAFSWTLFPHLSASIAAGDQAATRAYIRSAVRYLAMALVPGTLLVLGTAAHLIPLVYPGSYSAGAPLLNLLIISTGFYSLYIVFANAILAEGKVLLAMGISGALAPVSLAGSWYLTARMGAPGAAWTAILTTGLAALATGGYVVRRFSVRLDAASLLRVSVASAGLFALTRVYVPRGAWMIPYGLALGVAYLAVLFLLGEVRTEDLRGILNRQ